MRVDNPVAHALNRMRGQDEAKLGKRAPQFRARLPNKTRAATPMTISRNKIPCGDVGGHFGPIKVFPYEAHHRVGLVNTILGLWL